MRGQTLVAVRESASPSLNVLETADQRFSVSAWLWGDVDPDYSYVQILARFESSNQMHSFGFFAVVVDDQGALLQMAVGNSESGVCESIRERLIENEIKLRQEGERLTADRATEPRTSALMSMNQGVSVRAKAYLHDQLTDESVLCLRLELAGFGAAQLAISDIGRLLAMATGRRDRQAFQRVRHELARRSIHLDEQDSDGTAAAEMVA